MRLQSEIAATLQINKTALGAIAVQLPNFASVDGDGGDRPALISV
jgi:hypothetical protein